jgi:hypothetical protein
MENILKSGHLINPDVDGRKILKGMSNKLNLRKWAGLIRLDTWHNSGVLGTWSDGAHRPLAQNYAKCHTNPNQYTVGFNGEGVKVLMCVVYQTAKL